MEVQLSFIDIWMEMSVLGAVFMLYIVFMFWEITAVTLALLNRSMFALFGYMVRGEERLNRFNLDLVADEFSQVREISAQLAKNGSPIDEVRLTSAVGGVWRKVDEATYFHISGLSGHVYSLILWGFAGTIYGTMTAFSELAVKFGEGGADTGQIVQSALGGGLLVAMISSLLASGIGASVWIIRRMLLRCIIDFEAVVGKAIDESLLVSTMDGAYPSNTESEHV